MELLTLCFNQNVTSVTCVTQKHVSHATYMSHAILISCSNGLAFLGLRFKSLIPGLKSGIQPEVYCLFYLFSITEAVSKLRHTRHVTPCD